LRAKGSPHLEQTAPPAGPYEPDDQEQDESEDQVRRNAGQVAFREQAGRGRRARGQAESGRAGGQE
jgi:hypothetical protein